jgi:2'-5' RNA ligase
LNVELIRSFIAIELPEEIKTELKRLQSTLKAVNSSWLKWVSPDSIHLTLKFLGDITGDKIEEITTAITDASNDIGPFYLKLDGLGVFPNQKRIQVVWVGLSGDLDKLSKLQKQIEDNMAILGYPEEDREFTPHLTLARVRFQPPPAELQKFTQLLTSTKFDGVYQMEVKAVNLMRSQLTPQGAIYSQLNSVALKLIS